MSTVDEVCADESLITPALHQVEPVVPLEASMTVAISPRSTNVLPLLGRSVGKHNAAYAKSKKRCEYRACLFVVGHLSCAESCITQFWLRSWWPDGERETKVKLD